MSSGYGAVSGGEDAPREFVKKRWCNDIIFAILFVAHLVVIITVLAEYEAGDEDVDWTSKGVYKFVGIVSLIAILCSTLSLGFMAAFSGLMIEIALISSLIGALAVAFYGIFISKLWMAIVGGVAFLAAFTYTCCIWKHIAFAHANMKTAITAVQTNIGLALMAYIFLAVAFGWTILWVNAAGAAMNQTSWWIVFLYFLSFFWTQQVINNIVHTIVASVIGTWWYNPIDANSCWDDGLNAAICQTLTYNFGSICFGSLFASIVQALKYTLRFTQRSDYLKWLTCMLDCCLSCVQELIEYFNKWCFTYVGLHGERYITSGREVVSLFKERGWVGIIDDMLADVVMWTMTVSIAFICGLSGWGLVTYDDDIFTGIGIDSGDDDLVGFIAGFLIGYLLAGVMMNLVGSAINAIIVCFAEAPKVFKENHPVLCAEMLGAWKKSYPDECADDFDDVNF